MIESVSRALQILELLSDRPKGATLMTIVTALGMEKSGVSRILATLEKDGYVTRDAESDVFRITLRFAGMALRHVERVGLVEVCLPALQELAQDTGELVQLAVIASGRPIYIAKAVGSRRIQAMPLLGTNAELHASAAGKLWLASLEMEDAMRFALAAGLRKITPHTITTVKALQTELTTVRRNGFATVDRELSEDMNAMALPVRHSQSGELVAALVLTAPAYRLGIQHLKALAPSVRATAQQLGELLGVYHRQTAAGVQELSNQPE